MKKDGSSRREEKQLEMKYNKIENELSDDVQITHFYDRNNMKIENRKAVFF